MNSQVIEKKRKFDNSIYDKIEIGNSEISGKGVFAKEKIPKNTIYLHGIIKLDYDYKGFVINFYGGETLRFLNHSFNPNVKNIRIDNKIFGVTLRDIKKGEELTSNYDDADYTMKYDDMIKVKYEDTVEVKKVKTSIPFFKYKFTPKNQ